MSIVIRDVARSEELGRRFLDSTFDFLCHIHSSNGGTTTQQRNSLCLHLPASILKAAEHQLAALPRQDPGTDCTIVGEEPYVGDPVAKALQNWFQPTIVYYDGRKATKYDRQSNSDVDVPAAVVSAAGHFQLGTSGQSDAGIDCFSVHSVKSKNMTARKSFNPNTEDGRVIVQELRSELQGRRGVVVLKLLALSLPLTSQHSERPFRLLWTLPSEEGGLVQICTPPFTVAKRTPTRGEAVPRFQPSRSMFPEMGKESTEALLRAVAVASKDGVGTPAGPPRTMQGFAGVSSFPAPPPGVPTSSPPYAHAGNGAYQVPVVVSAAASGSSSGSGGHHRSFRHLAVAQGRAPTNGRDPSVHLPAPPAVIPVPMPGQRGDSVADARNMAAAAYSRGMTAYSAGYGGGYHAPAPHGMHPQMYPQVPAHVYDPRYPMPYSAPYHTGDGGDRRMQAPPGPPQDEGMRLPQHPPGAGNALYMGHDDPNYRAAQGAGYRGPRPSNDSLVGPDAAGGHHGVVKPAFLQHSSSSGPNTSGSVQRTSSGSGHGSQRGSGNQEPPAAMERNGMPARTQHVQPQHAAQGGDAFVRSGALVAKRVRSGGSSTGFPAAPAKRAARGYKEPQFAVPGTSDNGAGEGSFFPRTSGGGGFGATSDGGVSINGLSGLGADAGMPGGWGGDAASAPMRTSSPAVPNRMPAAMGGAGRM